MENGKLDEQVSVANGVSFLVSQLLSYSVAQLLICSVTQLLSYLVP